MFELRCRGTLSDQEIVDEINKMGYKTRKRYIRDPQDRIKIIGENGSKPLNLKHFWRFIQNPIFAGVNYEKWTDEKLIKGKFNGLISIDMFNNANNNKLTLIQNGDEIKLLKKDVPEWRTTRLINNPKFPYKRVIMCPHCDKPLFGSASRGKLGKYYSAYHCNKRGHYFRVPAKDLEKTVEDFIRSLNFTQEYIDDLKKYIVDQWNERIENKIKDTSIIDNKIMELKTSAQAAVSKIKYLSSEVAIKYMEADLVKSEIEIEQLENEKKEKIKPLYTINIENVMEHIGYFLEHLEELLIDTANPLKRAAFFGLIFDHMPNYTELTSGTPKLAPYLRQKEYFKNPSFSLSGGGGIRTHESFRTHAFQACAINH